MSFVLVLSFSAIIGIHASIVGDCWAIGKIELDSARESNVGSVGHEHAEMAMGSSAEWGGDGLWVFVEFKLQLTDSKRSWMHVWVQRGERVMR